MPLLRERYETLYNDRKTTNQCNETEAHSSDIIEILEKLDTSERT